MNNTRGEDITKGMTHLKLLFTTTVFLVFGALFSAMGQSPITTNAIGLRAGDDDGLGTEISYQGQLKTNTRLELDLGFRDSDRLDAFKITGIHQWVRPIGSSGFNWYFGAGAGLGFVDYDDNFPFEPDEEYEEVFVSIDGMLGLEYSFFDMGVPIQISLDVNPQVELINENYSDDLDLDLALGIRYQW